MPKLIIDNREIEVPAGTKVIEAAERLGIMIPRFCYHPALGSVGACRVCAVSFLEGPVKGVQMSCMVAARDGMVVSTTAAEAVDFRRQVIEWLMLHHPHDCPVCDEGGHCLLQDMTVAGGHGRRRTPGRKRTHTDQDLGPLVQHEMNRCIQCYRCSRFYQEYGGYRDLGVLRLGHRVYFGRQSDGTLESPFAGNLIDVCPTGVFTDKPSRFKGRRWDYVRTPAICLNCSLGCHTVVSARYREVVRQEARFSAAINGDFICDRGRYGFFYASRPERPRMAALEGQAAALETALAAAVERIEAVVRQAGPAAVACAGSPRSSLDTLATIDHVTRQRGWHPPAYWMDRDLAGRVESAASRLTAETAVSLRQIEDADAILVVGADPINEAPMLALALRQAWRRGARVIVIDPRPIGLPFAFDHLPAAPHEIALGLGTLIQRAIGRSAAETLGARALSFYDAIPQAALPIQDRLDALADVLKTSRRPVVVCGTGTVSDEVPALAADVTRLLGVGGRPAGLFYVLPGANAFGAALLSTGQSAFEDVLAAIEDKTVRALVLVECDPLRYFADRPRLERALAALDLLVVMDYLASETTGRADIFLPTVTVFETGGLFINQEGRLQSMPPSFRGGLPIRQAGDGRHPPRVYGTGMPGVDPIPAGRLLTALAGEIQPGATGSEQGWRLPAASLKIADFLPGNGEVAEEGVRLLGDTPRGDEFAFEWPAVAGENGGADGPLPLLMVDWTFGTEELSSHSACLVARTPEPVLFMHARDAARSGLADNDAVVLTTPAGSVAVGLRVVDTMRAGVLVLPRHHRLAWQQLGRGPVRVERRATQEDGAG
ncbi:MAG: NADH-quinone oxidoreductase subunit NuoG [Desulfobacterales bacterium]